MTRTIILFTDAARELRHCAIAKSGVRITFALPRRQRKRHTLSRMENVRSGSCVTSIAGPNGDA